MGLTISKSRSSEERLAQNIRKQNCKITEKLYAIIRDAYINNWLSEYEFHATIGWYYGLKHRYEDTEEEAFAAGLDKINDLVCSMINERYNDVIKDSPEDGQSLLPRHLAAKNLTNKDIARYKKLLANSSYART